MYSIANLMVGAEPQEAVKLTPGEMLRIVGAVVGPRAMENSLSHRQRDEPMVAAEMSSC